jgi:hypothetical protein
MSKEGSIPAEGTVIDKLPNALFKVGPAPTISTSVVLEKAILLDT